MLLGRFFFFFEHCYVRRKIDLNISSRRLFENDFFYDFAPSYLQAANS